MKELKLLIVDDNKNIRDGIRMTLNLNKTWDFIIEEATNGIEAIEKSNENNFDIILMDMSMPIMGGMEAIKVILSTKINQKIIGVSMHSSKNEIESLKTNGVRGYILKEDVPTELIKTIEKVLNDEIVFNLRYY